MNCIRLNQHADEITKQLLRHNAQLVIGSGLAGMRYLHA